MMKQHSTEFIKGYVFAHMEDTLHSMIIQGYKEMSSQIKVPKIWHGLKCSHDTSVTISPLTSQILSSELPTVFNDLAPKHSIHLAVFPQEQYIVYRYSIKKRVKEMTISEIEKELGYPIEIVKE